jgi:hypothetical protein
MEEVTGSYPASAVGLPIVDGLMINAAIKMTNVKG